MAKKRQKWKLPKTYKTKKSNGGRVVRIDGEPRFYELVKFDGDRTLITDTYLECCDCGLTHHHTFNVLKVRGTWFINHRAYRVPTSGKGGEQSG